jgi:peptidoglycan/xylan/chitin deacetylase (PgdA/CDA1 family)
MSWNHINQMIITGHGEFQNHTYNMHTSHMGRRGAAQKQGESIEVYSGMLNDDLGRLQDRMREITGFTPTTFTYPFGFISDSSRDILKEMGFRATLSCREGINQITRNPNDLFSLKRYLRSPERSVQEILSNHN